MESELKIGRRQLLKGSSIAVGVATLGPVALMSGGPASAQASDFDRGYFDQRVGGWFHIAASTSENVELIEVLGSEASPVLEQFILRFRGSPHAQIEEGLYEVSPPDGDTFALHVQPAGIDETGCYYEAAFSLVRLIAPSCAGAA